MVQTHSKLRGRMAAVLETLPDEIRAQDMNLLVAAAAEFSRMYAEFVEAPFGTASGADARDQKSFSDMSSAFLAACGMLTGLIVRARRFFVDEDAKMPLPDDVRSLKLAVSEVIEGGSDATTMLLTWFNKEKIRNPDG